MPHHSAAASVAALAGLVVLVPPAPRAEVPSDQDSPVRIQQPPFTARAASGSLIRPSARRGPTHFSNGFEAGMGDWSVSDLSGTGAQWGDWSCWSGGGSRSAGCAAGGAQAVGCGQDYRNGMKTWMIQGPFSLAQFSWAQWEFTFKLESEPTFDTFFAGISTDGVDFSGSFWSGRAEETVVFDLPLSDEVWIGFQFASDPSAGRPEGAQVDDVVIRTSVPPPLGGFGWTISDSPIDPLSNTSTPLNGEVVTLYLWFYCMDPIAEGVISAEFDLDATSGLGPLSFTGQNGFLNAGNAEHLLIASPCRLPPVVAGEILMLDDGDGLEVCPGPPPSGTSVGVDCRVVLWPIQFIGYDSTPTANPCQSDPFCSGDPFSVEPRSWGSIKALYR